MSALCSSRDATDAVAASWTSASFESCACVDQWPAGGAKAVVTGFGSGGDAGTRRGTCAGLGRRVSGGRHLVGVVVVGVEREREHRRASLRRCSRDRRRRDGGRDAGGGSGASRPNGRRVVGRRPPGRRRSSRPQGRRSPAHRTSGTSVAGASEPVTSAGGDQRRPVAAGLLGVRSGLVEGLERVRRPSASVACATAAVGARTVGASVRGCVDRAAVGVRDARRRRRGRGVDRRPDAAPGDALDGLLMSDGLRAWGACSGTGSRPGARRRGAAGSAGG